METVQSQNPCPAGIHCYDIVAVAVDYSLCVHTTDRIDDGTHSPTGMIKDCVL